MDTPDWWTNQHEQVLDALLKAADKIAAAAYKAGLYKTKRNRKGRVTRGYTLTPAHQEVQDAINALTRGTIDPEEAMAILHGYDVIKARTASERTPQKTAEIMVWDNEGDIGRSYQVADRYTVVIRDPKSGFHVWSTDSRPDHPQGVGSYVGHYSAFNPEKHWGRRIPLKQVPATLMKWIRLQVWQWLEAK